METYLAKRPGTTPGKNAGAETLALLNRWNAVRSERPMPRLAEWPDIPAAAYTKKASDARFSAARTANSSPRTKGGRTVANGRPRTGSEALPSSQAAKSDPFRYVPSRAHGFLNAIAPLEKHSALNTREQSRLLRELTGLYAAELRVTPGERLRPELDVTDGRAELWLFDSALNVLHTHVWDLAGVTAYGG